MTLCTHLCVVRGKRSFTEGKDAPTTPNYYFEDRESFSKDPYVENPGFSNRYLLDLTQKKGTKDLKIQERPHYKFFVTKPSLHKEVQRSPYHHFPPGNSPPSRYPRGEITYPNHEIPRPTSLHPGRHRSNFPTPSFRESAVVYNHAPRT